MLRHYDGSAGGGSPLFFFCAAAAEQGQRVPAGEPQLGASAGCALADIVDCMLAAVRVSIGVLHGSESDEETLLHEEGLLHARA